MWFSSIPLCGGRDSFVLFQANKVAEMALSQFSQNLSIISFLLDNVLILGLVMEKSTLSLLLDAIFSLSFSVGFAGAAQGWPVTRADDQVTEVLCISNYEQDGKRGCLVFLEHFFFQLISGKTWKTKSGYLLW